MLTVLGHDPVGGLEVRSPTREWFDAAAPADGLVVNVGDMLELWSGGHLVSTPHRVVNRSGRQRRSFPFSSVPRYDVVLEPLVEPVHGFARRPLHVGRASADIGYSDRPGAASTEPGR